MFDWFRKPVVAPAPEKKDSGFFSTDLDFARVAFDAETILKRSFQKTDKHLKVTDASGTVSAMDSNESNVRAYGVSNTTIPDAQLYWYASNGFIGYQICAMLFQHWLIDKACTMPARDAIRQGYKITVNSGEQVDPKVLDAMMAADKRMGMNNQMLEFIRMGRCFGIRVAMFKVDSTDPNYYANPFNIDGVTPDSYRGIVQIDPYWIAPELSMAAASDPMDMGFYEPTWWNIKGRRVHKSHLCIFKTGEVPDVLKPTYFYGGVPVPQKIYERVYAAERTANEGPMLAMAKRTIAIHCDVAAALANPKEFDLRMEQWQSYMNNFGIKILGTDETMEQFDTSLTDLDAVIMTQYQIVAASANVPATKLLGTTPKGFNATGEFEESSYHEELESIQSHDLTPLLERHHQLLIRSEIAPKFKIAPFDTTVAWVALDSPTAKEQADTNFVKAQAASLFSQIGAIDGEDERARLISDPDSGYSGMPPTPPDDLADEEGDDLGPDA